MKRVFIAIEIHPQPEVLDIIDTLRDELQDERIRWVSEQHFHLTLKFMGNQSDEQISRLITCTEEVCQQSPVFSFSIGQPGYFRDRSQLRVLWLKILNTGQLNSFQSRLEEKLESAGFSKEDRRFQPHLTLGRIHSISDPRSFYELMDCFPDQTVQTVTVNQIILFESILKPSEPEYLKLKTFALQKKG